MTSIRSLKPYASTAGKRRLKARGERTVQRELRKTLLKYKLHTDQDLFDKAYGYIRQYY